MYTSGSFRSLFKLILVNLLLFAAVHPAFANTFSVPSFDADGNYDIVVTMDPTSQGGYFHLYERRSGNWAEVGSGDANGQAKSFRFSGKASGIYEYNIKTCVITASQSGSSTTCTDNFREVTVALANAGGLGGAVVDPDSDDSFDSPYYGALRGSHSVGVSGSFSYSVPIEIPNGINGV